MKSGNYQYALGFMSYCSHDPAAALARLGEDGSFDYIHFEEGMLSRKKKSYQFPLRAVQACLDYYGIGLEDVSVVSMDYMDQRTAFDTAKYYRKLVGDYIRAHLNLHEDQVYFAPSHHAAHAYTAFYPSGFDQAAVLVIDGLGSEQQTHSIYLANQTDGLENIYSKAGTGIGMLYNLITQTLGFDSGEEGKTMGLAPYGAEHAEMDAELPDLRGVYEGFSVDYSHIIQRCPSLRLLLDIKPCQGDVYGPYYARLAYNLQQELERCLLHLGRQIKERTGARRLCIAGGVGLNCVANEVLRKANIFDEIYVQPASGDSGLPLGLAMAGLEEAARRSGWQLPNWSETERFWTYAPVSFDNARLKSLLAEHGVACHAMDLQALTTSLADKKVVAYYEDGWDFGPRALGHRSFLADPRPADMKAILNGKIKHREAYRPFAPIIMAEHFVDFFESPVQDHPHMLFAVTCRERAHQDACTVVHVDGTARVQTCDQDTGRIYQVIDAFHKLTGVPVLVNTSFNDNDEPIVLTPLDALSCFLRTNADILVVDDVMVNRAEIPNVGNLLAAAEKAQRQDIYANSDRALRNLLRPEHQDLNQFLTRNLLSSIYARNNAALDRLAEELFGEDSKQDRGVLVTDKAHLEILYMLAGWLKRRLPFSDVIEVDDRWSSLADIPAGSYVLLYNLSVCIQDQEAISAYPAIASCHSFYRNRDRRIEYDRALVETETLSHQIAETYEVDPDRTIGQLFDCDIRQAFIRAYL